MDGLTLLRAARALGFTVGADGDHLVVRGPKRLAPVARHLLAHKAQVLAVLPHATDWPAAAQERFVERLAAADELGVWPIRARPRGRWQCARPGGSPPGSPSRSDGPATPM